MGPKKPFKVHSLNKHIEATKKGLSAEAQYNKRAAKRPAAAIKKEAQDLDKAIFGNQDDEDDGSDSDDSSSSDGSDNGAEFLTKLAPKGSNTDQPSSIAKPKPSDKRKEIADNGTEAKAAKKKKLFAGKEKSAQTIPSTAESSSESGSSSASGSDSESDSESDSGSEQRVNKSNGAPVKQNASSATSSTSSDSDSGSDSDDDDNDSGSSSDEEEKPASKSGKQVAAKMRRDATSSSESSSEESDEDSSKEPKSKKSTAGKSVNGKTVISTSASRTRSDDSEDESSGEGDEADESMHISERRPGSQRGPNFMAPDFVLRKSDDGSHAADVARICSEANTQGKQFWYFTVPANVPISVVQNLEIPVDQDQTEKVFSHAGEDYGVSFDSMTPKSSIQILIPSANGSQYQSGPRPIDHVMQIKKITQVGDSVPSASPVGPSPKAPPRQQPKNLKARFQPIGVTTPMGRIGAKADADGDEDDEMPDVSTPQKISKAEKKEKQRKEKEQAHGDTPRKNKRKHTASEDEAAAAAEQLIEETETAETKSKKQRTASPDLGAGSPVAPNATQGPKTPSTGAKSKKETPIRVPRQTAVPIPHIPNSARRPTPVPVPQPGKVPTPAGAADDTKGKKKKSKKDKAVPGTAQSSPSAQSQAKPTKASTTVPIPTFVPKMG